MSKLVIVESPNKIKSIEKYLGEGYKVLASVGHIAYLPSSGEHRFGVDIETWTPNYKVDPKKKSVVSDLKEAAKESEDVLIATDPDREGEAIAENIVDFLSLKDKYKRIRFNEITKDAVITAISNPSKIDQELVNAQIARRILDRIIGYKLSSLMRKKVINAPTNPSAGRVQSIALKLVVEREREIEAFVPVHYSTINADLGNDNIASLYLADNKENKNWVMKDQLEDIKKKLKGSLLVDKINVSTKKDAKLVPLKQAALYKKADSSLGISSKSVQSAAQRLYEGYGDGGLISYPRTDSTRLSATFLKNAQAWVKSKYGDEYLAKDIKGEAGAQDAHEAIRPTNLSLTPEKARAIFSLSSNEYKVYKLIWTHTIQALMTVPLREITRYEFKEGDLEFRISSSRILFDGYYKLIGVPDLKPLPKLSEGEVVKVHDYIIEDHETKPPARYNDGSLIEKLDNIKVGRPSTFATTVNILKERDYVEMEGRALKPTEFAKIVNDKLIDAFPEIINEEYTAGLEEELDLIAEGKHDYKETLDNFWDKFKKELDTATINIDITKMMPIKAGKSCPKCNSDLIIKRNKRDGTKFFGCENFPECSYTESIPGQRKSFFKKWKK